ncbi:MAG: antibiotic biosynthesis monooxygenase [Flavobacterium sp.]|nr:antibiotic biosynthesis monooxygenase [Pedobacter sp.]
MVKFGLLAKVVAKPGKEQEAENFLKSALSLAQAEKGTIQWFAFKIDQSTFGIFDTFETEDARQAHLSGEIAKALMAKAPDLFSQTPEINQIDILASK